MSAVMSNVTPITGFLGQLPIWTFRNQDGTPLSAGYIYFYENNARSTYKTVYQDAAFTIPYTNPIQLDGKGECGPIYFTDDSLYYIEVYSNALVDDEADDETVLVLPLDPSDPTPGTLIWSIPDYPLNATPGGGLTTFRYDNILLNGQFNFTEGQSFTTFTPNPSGQVFQKIAEYWQFAKNNNLAVDRIDFVKFNLGDAIPESDPIQYVQYSCSATGGGEVLKVIEQLIPKVRMFEQETMTISFYAFSPLNNQISVDAVQWFGGDGSPEVSLPIQTFQLTPIPTKYTATFTLPTLSGKTLPSLGNDQTFIRFKMPLNIISQVAFTNAYLTVGNVAYKYPQLNQNLEKILVMSDVPIGCTIPFEGIIVPDGFLMANGSAVSRTTYYQLFRALSVRFGGTLTSGSNIITAVSSTANLVVGYPISGPGIPAGATIAGILSSTSISLSANATATGPQLELIAAPHGVGDGTTTFNLPNRAQRFIFGAGGAYILGQVGGQPQVTLQVGNLPPHLHGYVEVDGGAPAGAGGTAAYETTAEGTTTNGAEYGLNSVPFSIMPPYGVTNYIIKY
jgi:microcystin-dependent protein